MLYPHQVESRPTWSRTTPRPGKITLRNDNDRGAIGVRRKASVSGCDMDPPAEREYAVEPVGVDKRIPSAFPPQQSDPRPCDLAYNGFRQMLAVVKSVHNRQLRMASTVKGHFVHDLKPGVADCGISPGRLSISGQARLADLRTTLQQLPIGRHGGTSQPHSTQHGHWTP